MISVLMAIFAGEKAGSLRNALQSLVDQNLPADEVVLVLDGPVPQKLLNVIDGFRSGLNIKVVSLEQNRGLGAALKYGLERCSNEFVARLDADDTALPDRLQQQLSRFEAEFNLDILSGYAIEIDRDGKRGRVRTVPESHEQIINTLWANPIIHPAVMFKRERILDVGSYDPLLRRRQDYELWFRCAAAGLKFGNVPRPLIEYRFTSETHKRQSRRGAWQQGLIGFRGSRLIGLSLWKQLACFAPFARSLLPTSMRHHAYRVMQKFDPRKV